MNWSGIGKAAPAAAQRFDSGDGIAGRHLRIVLGEVEHE
jgi:hypothetical protein